jgi:hypothetical protein
MQIFRSLDSCLVPRRTSLCKKTWWAYDEFTWSTVVGRDGRRGLMGKVHLKCETSGSSWSISCNKVRFLASCDNSLSFTIFCYLFLLYWPMLIFFCHLGLNSCCYSWYIWHMPYLKSWNIKCQQPKRWRTRLAQQELDL